MVLGGADGLLALLLEHGGEDEVHPLLVVDGGLDPLTRGRRRRLLEGGIGGVGEGVVVGTLSRGGHSDWDVRSGL